MDDSDALHAEVNRRRLAEAHLLDIDQALALTLASIGAGFIATDRGGLVTRMNGVAERITGWTQAEAAGVSIWTVFVRVGRPASMLEDNPVDVLLAQGTTIAQRQHVEVIARDGTRCTLEVSADATRAPDGSPRGLAMVFRDLTAETQAMIEMQRLAAIVESSSDAIISKSLEGIVTSWNQAAERMFEWTADEAIGQPLAIIVPPERLGEETAILQRIAAGEPVPAFETVRRRRDGSAIEVQVTISPLHDPTGRIVGASKIARDLSPLRRAEAARLKAERLEGENRQIQEASRLKNQFLANMSHELRTPLNAIIGFTDLLAAGAVPPDSPRHAAFLGHIGTSGRHLLQLINDVLDLAKVEAGRFEFHAESVALTRLAREVADVLHASLLRKQLRLTLAIAPGLERLHLDGARLKQVLFNYLSNAIKFTPAGGQVTLRARPSGAGRFRVEVEDTGIGIPAADLGRLFVEFQQLDAGYDRRYSGTGLGLALTRRLVEAQGGSVGVRSTVGVGSVFHLELDCVVRRRREGDPEPTAVPPQSAPADPLRLLVIEDDADCRERLVQGLALAGFAVDAAVDAPDAVERAGATPYDGITLDLKPGDRPGLQALHDIRVQGESRAAAVIGMSMPTVSGETAAFAIADILGKPSRAQDVRDVIARLGLPREPRARAMVVDDDPVARQLMAGTLEQLEIDVVTFPDGRQALDGLDAHRPDVLVLDLMMPDFDGFAVLDAIGRRPGLQQLRVIIWTSLMLTDDEYARLARSALAIVGKGGGAIETLLARLAGWRGGAALALDGGDR